MTEEVALNVKFTGDSSGVVTESRRAADSVDDFGRKVDKSRETQHHFSRASRESQKAMRDLGDAVRVTTGLLAALGGAQVVSKFKDVAVETDKLRASLKTVTGSVEAAGQAFAELEKFAGKTPFTLDQSINAFIRMKSLGLDPTEKALTSFGNTASAMGKDLTQMIEAVADASTGEFERLKEFGIRAKQQGDEVSFTFQGVTTKVGKNADEIVDYLEQIGNAQFAGAMADQMQALPGLFSNLEDSTNSLFRTIGDLGASDALAGFVRGATEELQTLQGNLPELLTDTEAISDTLLTLGSVVIARTLVPSLITLGTTLVTSTTTMGAAAVAARGLTGAMALLGGPAGIAVIAGTALLAFGTSAADAAPDAATLTAEVDQLAAKFRTATEAQKEFIQLQLEQKLATVREGLKSTTEEIETYTARIQRMEGFDGPATAEQQQMFSKSIEENNQKLIEARARVDDLRVSERELVETISELGKVTNDVTQSTALNTSETKKNATAKTDAAAATELFGKNTKELDQFSKDLIESVKAETEAMKGLTDLMDEGKRLTEQLRNPTEVFADEQERLNQMLDAGAISQETYNRAVEKATSDLLSKNQQAAQQASTAWQDFGLAVQDAFRDTFIRAGDDLDDFLKRAEEALKEAARRWLFDSTIGRLFAGLGGGGFATGAAASTGATGATGGGGGIGSLMGGNYSMLGSFAKGASGFLYGANTALNTGGSYLMSGLNAAGFSSAAAGVGNYFAQTSALGNSIGSSVGLSGGGTFVGGLTQAGAGIAGSYVGNILGESIFNKEAESNIGATIGATGGAYLGAQVGTAAFPGVGTVIGAALGGILGALADVALGGDGKKRSNTGAIVGPTVTGGQVAASGLRIAPYERRGDQGAANQLANALVQLDGALTQITESLGVDVNFSGRALQGVNPDAGHDGPGIFFGAKGFNGATGFADAPDEFVKAWLAEVNDLLPARVKMIMEGVDGAAEALVTGFAAAVQIDNLLNLDVVKDTKKAVDELLTPQKILLELYDDTTEKVMALAAGIDGNAEGLTQLSEALREQKTAALELALAYQGVQLETTALFGGAIDDIRHALMSEEELYNERRGQIAELTEQLRTAISPDEISRLNQQIVGLTNEAFRSLDSGQQQTLGQEFLGFLNEAQRISEEQLAAGLASLASREEGIERTIELELSVAQQQQQAATTLQTATDRFGGWVDRLTSGQTTITINVPGYGQFNVPLGLDIATEITL